MEHMHQRVKSAEHRAPVGLILPRDPPDAAVGWNGAPSWDVLDVYQAGRRIERAVQ